VSEVNDVGIIGRQVVAEQKSFWRNPASAGFTIVFPIMFLVIFSSLNSGQRLGPEFGDILFTEYYVPGIIAFAVVTACFTNLSINLVRQRDIGILKRKRSTPLPATWLIAGLVVSCLIVSAIMLVLTTVVGMVGYGNAAPRHVVWIPLILVLGVATFCALGVAITSLIPNADAAPAIVNGVMFPLLFLSGAFFPVTNQTLVDISNVLPIRPFQQALLAAYDPQNVGAAPTGRNLLVLGIWAVVGVVIAARRFRWEPKHGLD
jgi:ABC-2 type transport system permease protein